MLTLEPRAAVELVREPALLTEADGRVLACNRLAADLLGIEPPDAEGRGLAELVSDGAPLGAALAAAVAGTGPVALPARLRTRAGLLACQLRLAPVAGCEGTGLLVAMPLEAEAWPDYVRQLAETTRQLDGTRALLSQAQHPKALGELAAEVAHEFGNVLQAVALHVAALRRQPALPEVVGRGLTSIKHAVDTGHALTRRLLTFARDDGEGRGESLDVGPLLRDALSLLQPRLSHTSGSIRVDVAIPPLPEIKGGAGKLTEAFLNVLVNAIEAMPEGGTLEVSAVANSGEVRIAIRDSGTGMAPDTLRRAFDPFFTTRPDSAGLGLSTVWGTVHAHGGTVFLDSDPGRGTTVCLSFPTARPPELEWRVARVGGMHEAGRALVVDDHPAVRAATSELLAGQGYEVESAGTVREALDALARQLFDVVVTDVGLPDRPGWDITRAAKERSRNTLVVLVSGWGAQMRSEDSRTRGVDLLFEKPIDPDALVAAIAQGVPG